MRESTGNAAQVQARPAGGAGWDLVCDSDDRDSTRPG